MAFISVPPEVIEENSFIRRARFVLGLAEGRAFHRFSFISNTENTLGMADDASGKGHWCWRFAPLPIILTFV
jgi:hypothetical protein